MTSLNRTHQQKFQLLIAEKMTEYLEQDQGEYAITLMKGLGGNLPQLLPWDQRSQWKGQMEEWVRNYVGREDAKNLWKQIAEVPGEINKRDMAYEIMTSLRNP